MRGAGVREARPLLRPRPPPLLLLLLLLLPLLKRGLASAAGAVGRGAKVLAAPLLFLRLLLLLEHLVLAIPLPPLLPLLLPALPVLLLLLRRFLRWTLAEVMTQLHERQRKQQRL